jgi:hypothetical protein
MNAGLDRGVLAALGMGLVGTAVALGGMGIIMFQPAR